MKKNAFLAAMLFIFVLFPVVVDTVHAVDVGYICTVNRIGAGRDGIAIFRLNCPVLSDTPKWFKGEALSYKSYMAMALTAMTNENEVFMVIDSTLGEWQPIKQFYIME